MTRSRSVPAGRPRARWPGIAGSAALVAVLVACSEAPPSVVEALTEACTDARDGLAAAPAPADNGSETAFRQAAEEATRAVGRVADELAGRGDDRTIADLAWQLHRFPSATGDQSVRAAHEASAAITRIDGLAQVLEVPACGAATWRPAGWRAMASRHADRPSDDTFRHDINQLCANTFPNPSLLDAGVPLLTALVTNPITGEGSDDPSDDVKDRLVARLRTVSDRPGDTRRFLTAFSNDLPQIRPSENLDGDYVALLAAFMRLDSAIPSAMPRDPPPDVRERVDAALDELQRAWEALDITC